MNLISDITMEMKWFIGAIRFWQFDDEKGSSILIILLAANVFGKPKTNTDYQAYNGNGFKLSIPSKWNPSKEVEYIGQVLRYEDNFDSTTNVVVTVTPTDKKSITDYGSPEEFLSQVNLF